eukprot:superscaffoldBa00000241_g3045
MLWDLHKALAREENPAKLLDEAHRTVAITPRTGMAETVVAQRHLRLTFKELPEMQYTEFLHQAVEPAGLFGQALETIVPVPAGNGGLYDSSGASGLADDEKIPALDAGQTGVLLSSERGEKAGHTIVPEGSAPMENTSAFERGFSHMF